MKRLCGTLAIGTLAAICGWAQLTRGFISGTVLDPTGASVSGAEVRITNLHTNLKAETVTNEAGIYRFAAVEPGAYRVEFSKAGFEDRQLDRIEVTTTYEAVVNAALSLAGVATAVSVEAPVGAGLAKASATVDLDLEGDLAEKMPLRDASFLARLGPLAVRGTGGVVSSAGHANTRNYFAIDGLDHGGLGNPLLPLNRLLPESVGEFHVQTVAYSAEFGHNYGALIGAITRSGSNQVHGQAWDYFQSSFLNSRSLPDKRAGIDRDRYVEHDAGGSLGGPIRKDRTFFFGLAGTDRQRTGPSTRRASAINIPTSEGYAALSGIPLAPGQTAESRQAALSALSFLTDIFPQIKSFQPAAPVNINGVLVSIGSAKVPLVVAETFWDWRGRVDHRLSEKDTLSFITQGTSDVTPVSVVGGNAGFGARFADSRSSFTDSFTLSHTRVMSPHRVNEARFGFTSNRNRMQGRDEQAFVTIGQDFAIGRAPLSGGQQEDRTYEWQDVTSYLAGRHAFKLGADITIHDLYDPAVNNTRGTWTFTGLATFLNSQAVRYSQVAESQAFDSRHWIQAYFIQDEFRATPSLTLTLGARYELRNAPHGYFGAAAPDVAAVGVPGPVQPDRNNIAPRAGLAWSPNPKAGLARTILGDGRTVFRGGYGMAYDWFGAFVAGGLPNSNYPRARPFEINPPETLNLFPRVIAKPAKGLDPMAPFINLPQDAQLPTTHFYSFSIQRQFARDYIVEVGYAGNRDYHVGQAVERNAALLTQAQANLVIAAGVSTTTAIPSVQQRRLNSAWGSRTVYETSSFGHYNALYARFDKRLSRGLLVGAAYTYSSSFANDSAPQQFFDYRLETGRTTNDRPHRAVVHYTYDIPAPRGLWRTLAAGWKLAGYSEWQSGAPFTVTTGVDSTGGGASPGVTSARPDYNPGGTISTDPVTGDMRSFRTSINGAGLFVTPLGRDGRPLANSMPFGGNLGKSTFRGPGLSLWNLDLARAFSIHERACLEFRADAENLFNHRNFGPPVFSMNSASFGSNTSDPGIRTMRLSLKLRL